MQGLVWASRTVTRWLYACVSKVNQTPAAGWQNKTPKHVRSLCISITITRNVLGIFLAPNIEWKKV
jgi:hypothetical protein